MDAASTTTATTDAPIAFDLDALAAEAGRVFKYLDDSHGQSFGDPMAIERRLYKAARKAGIDLDETLRTIARGDQALQESAAEGGPPTLTPAQAQIQDEALDDLIPILHQAFGTKPLGPGGLGLTEAEAILNLQSLFMLRASLKNGPGASPGSSPPTDAGPGDSA